MATKYVDKSGLPKHRPAKSIPPNRWLRVPMAAIIKDEIYRVLIDWAEKQHPEWITH